LGYRRKRRLKSILNIFRQLDQVIFPNSDSSLVGCADKDTSRGLKTALEMLEADETVKDETVDVNGFQILNAD